MAIALYKQLAFDMLIVLLLAFIGSFIGLSLVFTVIALYFVLIVRVYIQHPIHFKPRNIQRTANQRLLRTIIKNYRHAAELMPDGLFMYHRIEHRPTWLNSAAKKILKIDGLHSSDTSILSNDEFLKWVNNQEDITALSEFNNPDNPNEFYSLERIFFSDTHWLIIIREISQLVRLEQIRKDFVANVSHELRTPLTVIHGYLEMIEATNDQTLSPIIIELRKQSVRMLHLVEDLLLLSRLESQNTIEHERVDMSDLLNALGHEARALSQERHTINVLNCLQHDLLGNEKQLHSAFLNLISNAIRYTASGGTISIRFELINQNAQLSVTDNGYGIAAAHLPRLTERFYRASTSRSRESGGTGLGLSIVKHVLNAHQARLNVYSEVGKGSTFCCLFPLDRVLPSPSQDRISQEPES